MSNNKTIAKNTLFLYLRMIITMLITLYTSRVVLRELGVVDFGVYNVIGGIVSMLAFFQSSLVNATQRFLNISIGKNDLEDSRLTISQSLILYSSLSIILFIVGEIFGLWFIENKLIIPPERINAADIVLHTTLLATMVTMIQVPYVANIIAREKMDAYAYLSIVDVILKLIVAYSLTLFSNNNCLIAYSVLQLFNTTIVFFAYYAYCRSRFEESRIRLHYSKKKSKELSNFILQNMFGCVAWILGSQGVNIILNVFFGPIVNAARAITSQVTSAVFRFTDNILSAARPQIVMAYAQGNTDRMSYLVRLTTKLSFVLFMCITLPIYYNIDFILNIWLTVVPDYTSIFTRLLLIDSLVNALSTPLATVSIATGYIKRSQIYGKIFILMVLPLSYVAFKFGFKSPELVLYLTILADVLYLVYMIYDVITQGIMTFRSLLNAIMIPLIILSGVVFIFIHNIHNLFEDGCIKLLSITIISFVSTIFVSYILVLDKKERESVQGFVYKLITRYIR